MLARHLNITEHNNTKLLSNCSQISVTRSYHGCHTSCMNLTEAPSLADSANSHQGCFSRVQNANGMVHASCKHSTLTPIDAAASMSSLIFSSMALYCHTRHNARGKYGWNPNSRLRGCDLRLTCSWIGAVVGATIEFWIRPILTILGLRVCSALTRNDVQANKIVLSILGSLQRQQRKSHPAFFKLTRF